MAHRQQNDGLRSGDEVRCPHCGTWHPVNLRSDPSTDHPPIRLLHPSEPPLTLLEPATTSGYYHVRTSIGETGWVWGTNVSVSTTPPLPPSGPIVLGPGVPGSTGEVGCG